MLKIKRKSLFAELFRLYDKSNDKRFSESIENFSNLKKFCLPLEVFDDTEWDERTPDEWANLAPLPCRIFTEDARWYIFSLNIIIIYKL